MPSALVFYHYYYPDDVVSAIHLSELCEELVQRGWKVTAKPANRSCRHDEESYPLRGRWKGVRIQRIWRPPLPQRSAVGRLASSAWMLASWTFASLGSSPDVLIIGTDPILSVSIANFWKMIHPKMRIAHWCFDLYPEAAIADGVLRDGLFVKILGPILRRAYRCCDLIADLGCCMRKRMEPYGSRAVRTTLTPWALDEPDTPIPIDLDERRQIFGDATLALLYSGNFGRAHSGDLLVELARRLQGDRAHLAFSIRGNRAAEIEEKAKGVPNVSFVPFADFGDLERRLSAADIHVASLQEKWTGTVVPSKFFGSLAVGRPVLFSGSPDSCIAKWIAEHQVGWVLTESTLDSVCRELSAISRNPAVLARSFAHCHAVYQRYFSKALIADEWDRVLRAQLPASSLDSVEQPAGAYVASAGD